MEIEAIVQSTVEELLRAGEQHSCIFSASVLLDVLAACGIEGARPLTVKVRIFNPVYYKRLQSGRSLPSSPEEIAEWTQAGAAGVSIGDKPLAPGEWPAHLVVVPQLRKEEFLVLDITLPQANAPHFGIHLVPGAFIATEEFISGAKEFPAVINSSLAVYKSFPLDVTYEDTKAWSRNERKNRIIQGIVQRLGCKA